MGEPPPQPEDPFPPAPPAAGDGWTPWDGPAAGADEPPAPPPPPKFCRQCGAAWDPTWTACPHCARSAASAPASLRGARPRRFHKHSLVPALAPYFAMLACTGFAGALLLSETVSEATAEIIATAGLTMVVLLWMTGTFQRVRPGLRQAEGKWYAAAIGLGMVTFGIALLMLRFLVATLGVEEYSYSEPLLAEGYGWGMVFLLICVQPAVIEELAFRGIIVSALEDVLSRREALIVSALMFMVLHLTVLSFPHLLVIGLVLGWLRVRSKSLYPCVLMHFIHNLLVVLAEMGGL